MIKEISVDTITKTVKELCIDSTCSLPKDVEKLIREAVNKEVAQFGRYRLEKIVKNIEMSREENEPMCQDTGMVIVFAEIGQDVHITKGSLIDAINEGVRQGYRDGYLRRSVVSDPLLNRKETGDNTPAVIYTELVPGDELKIQVLPKGAGSEHTSAIKMLKPAEGLKGIKQFIIKSVTEVAGNPCSSVIVGVGIGGTMDKSTLLAKKALTRKVGSSHSDPAYCVLEEELLEEINRLGIGPQGFGGEVPALAVHIETFPTHIDMMPVAVFLNSQATCHKEAIL